MCTHVGEEAAPAEVGEAVAVATEAVSAVVPSVLQLPPAAVAAAALPAAEAIVAPVATPAAAVAVSTTRAVAVAPASAAAAVPAALGPQDVFYDAQEETAGKLVVLLLAGSSSSNGLRCGFVTGTVQSD
jgi:hypothetical protein